MSTARGEWYYAVRRGRNPGVYGTWRECQEQVKGFPDASFKKFDTSHGAEAFIRTSIGNPGEGSSVSQSVQQLSLHPDHTKSPQGQSLLEPELKPGQHHVVYCRCTCSNNGQPDATAGLGAWWGSYDSRNLAERCPGLQTNQRAELMAVIRVLETAQGMAPSTSVKIKSDSDYVVEGINVHLSKWRSNGYRAANGQRVMNAPLFQYLAKLLDGLRITGMEITLQSTSHHPTNADLVEAKRLSDQGARAHSVPERDWNTLIGDFVQTSQSIMTDESNSAGAGGAAVTGLTIPSNFDI